MPASRSTESPSQPANPSRGTETYVEARVAHARRIELTKDAFKGADGREIGEEFSMLPMSDAWCQFSITGVL